MSLRFFSIILFLSSFIFSIVKGQDRLPTSIPVYADLVKGDSISKAIEDLFKELNKVSPTTCLISPATLFKTEGILLINNRTNRGMAFSVPPELKKFGPEGIFIRGNRTSVILAGNSNLAIQEGIFLYLEQLGFRYLLPGSTWEVIPSINTPYKVFSLLTRPLYEWRTFFNGHGYANKGNIERDFYKWAKANRLGGSFRMWLGHSYGEIVQNNQQVFKEHPEFFSIPVQKGTIPSNPKFNVANPELVKLVVKDGLDRFRRIRQSDPAMRLLSMEPSDGPGFCTSPACKRIGSPSDQVFYLANKTAKALCSEYPDAWVGSYAYNEHILPTKLTLEPNIFVMITNGFNRSKYNTMELLNLWRKKAKKVGVYEYLSVYEWDFDMPGQMNAANTNYLKWSVKKYYENGARAYIGESVMGWISKGWGQYLLTRLLWDYNVNVDSLKKDFFEKAFENVAPQMQKLYAEWEIPRSPIPSVNYLANWLSLVKEAYEKARNRKVRERIDQVKMYLHYLVLYSNLKKDLRKDNFISVMEYANRTFEVASFATLPCMISLGNYSGFQGMGFYDNGSNEWKNLNNEPLTTKEININFQNDLNAIKKIEGLRVFDPPKAFKPLNSIVYTESLKYPSFPITYWDPTDYIVQIKNTSKENFLQISHGASASPSVARPLTMEFYSLSAKNQGEEMEPVLKIEQTTKLKKEQISLAALKPGFYRLRVNDWRMMFTLTFSPSINYSIVAGAKPGLLTTSAGGMNHFYLYVPPDVKRFIINKTVVLNIISPTGRLIDKSNRLEESIIVEVGPGEHGIWQISNQSGRLSLEGVAPYLGVHPSTMLVPSNFK